MVKLCWWEEGRGVIVDIAEHREQQQQKQLQEQQQQMQLSSKRRSQEASRLHAEKSIEAKSPIICDLLRNDFIQNLLTNILKSLVQP